MNNPASIRKTKKAIVKALRYQMEGRGYSFVEVLSMCPTNWGVEPVTAAEWVKDAMVPFYPMKVFRDRPADEAAAEKKAS